MNKSKKFWFNGYEYEIIQSLTIKSLTYYFNYNYFFILEYNFTICNKKIWNKIFIKKNDKIEIITLVGGG